MKTCENCGERVYSLGCTWCNEEAYIRQQEEIDSSPDIYVTNHDRQPTAPAWSPEPSYPRP